jgi:hypothetical protein
MPRGPKGEKRPADVIGNAVHVMRIATGELEDDPSKAPKRAKGGNARAKAPASRMQQREQRSYLPPMSSIPRYGEGVYR